MTTTTLSSKGRFKHLLGGMLRKNIPLMVYLSVILFLLFPLQTILNTVNVARRIQSTGTPYMGDAALNLGIYTEVSIIMVVGILLLSTFVIGLVQSSYLHSKRAVDLYHSLPVTRTQLMSANMLTAFLTVLLPYLLNYILNLFAVLYRHSVLGTVAGTFAVSMVFWDIVGWCVTVFAILAVVMLVSTQVGSIFENFLFAGELLATPIAVIFIVELLCQQFLVGYVTNINGYFVAASSPVGLMVSTYAKLMDNRLDFQFLAIAVLGWAVLGAAIFGAAIFLGRRRNSELAETTGCQGVVGKLLMVIAVYIGGIGVGSLLYTTFDTTSEAVYLLSVVIGAVLVFFFAEAVLNRGFAGIRKTLPLGALCTAFVFSATFLITSGGAGYEMHRPLTKKVESVTFDYRGWYDYVTELDAATKTDYSMQYGEAIPHYSYQDIYQVELKSPEAIDLVRDIHLLMIDDAKKGTFDYWTNSRQLQYTLKNGGTVRRRYDGYSEATAKYLGELRETPEFQEQTNPVLRVASDSIQSIRLHDSLGFIKYELGISGEMGTLLEAMRQDARANGTRDFTAGSPVLGYIYVNTGGYGADGRNLTENLITNFSIPVFASSTQTIAVLDSMGKGDAFGAPDLSVVTEIGFDRYDNWRSSSSHLVTGVDCFTLDKEAHDYKTAYNSNMKLMLEKAARFSEPRLNYYSSGYRGDYTYFTLYKGDEVGITVMVLPEQLPQELKDMFPELQTRNEYKEQTHTMIG